MEAIATEVRPAQRGLLCLIGFFGFLAAGATLLSLNARAWNWPVVFFAFSVVALMGTSALYHRVTWSSRWYGRIRRVDHAMIFVLIAGTEAPLFLLALEGRGLDTLYYVALGTAAVGFTITMCWAEAPKWVRALIYVVVGWSGVPAAPALANALGPGALALLILGGVLYSVGAVAYGLKRPNPWPGRFGYHEVFHAFVLAAVTSHYAVIAFWVVG